MMILKGVLLTTALTMLRSLSIGQTMEKADSLFAYKAWSLARSHYMALLADTGTTAVGWYRLGYCNQRLGNYDDAFRDYRRSMDLHPSRPLKALLYSKMAAIHSRRKQDGSALDDLDSAVANGYLNWSELDSAKDFAHLRGEKRFAVLSQSVYAGAYPCMSDPHAREFDFWVGEWDVYVTGTWYYAGHSLIQRISGGCSLLENWDSPSSSGKSINFIDPVGNKWKQSWSGSYKNGNQEFTDGEYRDDAMWFNFVTTNAANQKITGRLIFYNLGNGRVRQLSQSYDDGAKAWTTNYDFTYIRKAS